MGAHEAAFSMINSDNIDTRTAAAWALMRMHKKEVVDELLKILSSEKDAAKRKPLLSLSRDSITPKVSGRAIHGAPVPTRADRTTNSRPGNSPNAFSMS